MKKTGGGRLTFQEQHVVNSPAYADLILKLGISATGSEARTDSDAHVVVQPPTSRLQNILRIDSNDNTRDFDISIESGDMIL